MADSIVEDGLILLMHAGSVVGDVFAALAFGWFGCLSIFAGAAVGSR